MVEIDVATTNGLRQALENADDDVITVITMEPGEYVIDELMPPIDGRIEIIGSGDVDVLPAEGYNNHFLSVHPLGNLSVENLMIRDFRDSAFIVSGDAQFDNCVFQNNSGFAGGAIDGLKATLVIEDCLFLDNSATAPERGGGAINLFQGSAEVTNSEFRENTAEGAGGAIRVKGISLLVDGGLFERNFAQEDGGAVFVDDGFVIEVRRATFDANIGDDGGGLYAEADRLFTSDNHFKDNGRIAGGGVRGIVTESAEIRRNVFQNNFSIIQEGNNLAVELVNEDTRGTISGNVFTVDGSGGRMVRTRGRGRYKIADNSSPMPQDNVFFDYNFFNDSLALGARLRNNIGGGNIPDPPNLMTGGVDRPGLKSTPIGVACESRGAISGEPFESGGYNIFGDDSCPADGPSDLSNTDPMFDELTEDGVAPLLPDSPGIDGGPAELIDDELPCDYKDIRGLARPQDANSDGVAECDVGAWEQQAGDDLNAAASGAFFDLDRDGEGIFVEMIGSGLAVVYVFTYFPDGSGQAWFLGVGQVTGNSIVIDDLQITSGGIFGEDFDPANVVFTSWGSFSVSLPDCQGDSPGVMTFTGNADLGYEPLIVRPVRLTSMLTCPDAAQKTGVKSEFSGSWFDPEHNGEGFIIEIISDDTAVVQWFTYDDQGKQFWIQGIGSIDGMTITVDEAFYTLGATWGSGFNPNDVQRTEWGNVMIMFTDCGTATASYASLLPRFGSGSQSLIRLTNLDGLACND